jgi:hypothetical protein
MEEGEIEDEDEQLELERAIAMSLEESSTQPTQYGEVCEANSEHGIPEFDLQASQRVSRRVDDDFTEKKRLVLRFGPSSAQATDLEEGELPAHDKPDVCKEQPMIMKRARHDGSAMMHPTAGLSGLDHQGVEKVELKLMAELGVAVRSQVRAVRALQSHVP